MEHRRVTQVELFTKILLTLGPCKAIHVNNLHQGLGASRDSLITIMAQDKIPVNEVKMNLLGKIFFTSVAAWLVGKAVNLKIRGTQEEIQAVSNAMLASKRFQDELNNPGATVESVMQKLGLKHATAREFERILGICWPL